MPTIAPTQLPASLNRGAAVAIATSAYKGVASPTLVAKNWGAIPATLAAGIINGATSTELPASAGTVTFTADTDGTSPLDAASRQPIVVITDPTTSKLINVFDLSVPVGVLGTVTHATSIVACTVLVTGYDEYLVPMTESFSITATGTSKAITGKKAFRYIRSVALTAAADATANTLTLATGNVYGLPVRITLASDVLVMRMDSAAATATIVVGVTTDPATATTGDVRGTVDFGTDPSGSAVYSALLLADLSTQTSTYGITQA